MYSKANIYTLDKDKNEKVHYKSIDLIHKDLSTFQLIHIDDNAITYQGVVKKTFTR